MIAAQSKMLLNYLVEVNAIAKRIIEKRIHYLIIFFMVALTRTSRKRKEKEGKLLKRGGPEGTLLKCHGGIGPKASQA